jgi:hypothetical protein
MRPETTRMAWWSGRLVIVTDADALMLELDNDTWKGVKQAALTRISDRPIDLMASNNGELLMLKEDGVWQWNAGDRLRPYKWTSAELQTGGVSLTSFRAAMEDRGGARLTVTTHEGGSWSASVSCDKPGRLGRLPKSRSCKATLEGVGEISALYLGTSYATLGEGT